MYGSEQREATDALPACAFTVRYRHTPPAATCALPPQTRLAQPTERVLFNLLQLLLLKVSQQDSVYFETVFWWRWSFCLVFFLWVKGTFPTSLGQEAGGNRRLLSKAWCLWENRREVIRLAQQCAIIYEVSPFLTFPLFMLCNFNVINTKRFTAVRWKLPSFISTIKQLVPTVAFPFNCLLGWSPGF